MIIKERYQAADLILFDSYGILNLGAEAVAGMPQTIARLKKTGKQVRVLTNNASLNGAGIAEFLGCMGYDFHESEIVTCGHALKTYMRKFHLEGSNVFCIGPKASFQYVWEADGIPVNRPNTLGRWEEADLVVLASNGEMDEAQYQTAKQLLSNGVRTVCLNADIVAPASATRLSETMGSVALQLERECGKSIEMLGKPFPWIFDTALRPFMSLPSHKILMVGDSLFTDALGAVAAGLTAVLAPSAIPFASSDKSILEFCREAGIHPHYYVESLSALCI